MENRGKDYISYINIGGAVSSILALLLTLSQNDSFAFVLKSLVAIAFFIATAGTLGMFSYRFRKWLIVVPKWPYVFLYWLVIGMGIAFVSLLFAVIGYFLINSFIYLFSTAIHDIQY